MSEEIEDFEGKKFVVSKEQGSEIWTSVDNSDWKFKLVDMSLYQGENALNLGLRYSRSIALKPENLPDVMPIIDKMFIPMYKGNYVQGAVKAGNIMCVCNASEIPSSKFQGSIYAARLNTGMGALTRYVGEKRLYLSPGKSTFFNDKYLRQLNKEDTLTCLDLIEARENISYLDSEVRVYLNKMAAIMKQVSQETDLDRLVTVAEKLLEKNKNWDYYTNKEVSNFWMSVVSLKPELAETGMSYVEKAREAYAKEHKEILEVEDKNHDYIIFLQGALSLASGDNRLKLLGMLAKEIKNNQHLSSSDMYFCRNTPFSVSYCEALTPQNKKEEQIITDILKTTAKRDTTVFLHLEMLNQKPELAPVLLPIVGSLKDKDIWGFEEFSEWLTKNYEQHKDIIKASGLVKYLDNNYVQQWALKDHSIIKELKYISEENFSGFAKIYEDYATKILENDGADIVGKKNVVLKRDKSAQEIMKNIKDKILDNKSGYVDRSFQIWLVKNAQEFPNFANECIKSANLPFVEMCVNNIENPKKENIASLLNRLEAKEATTFEDFQKAREFVARRDMCRFVCKRFNMEHPYIHDGKLYFNSSTNVDEGQLSYDMAEAGIDNRKVAERTVKLFSLLNERPGVHGSEYNDYYPSVLRPLAEMQEMQDWMYPVMIKAVQSGSLNTYSERLPSERTLFDCCKAWKICPEMPQRLAEKVGRHSLYGRMLAGAVFEQMSKQGKTEPEEWKENKALHEKFFEELSRAEKMDRAKALKQYIPNTTVNRKRLVGAALEEGGVENTPDNFRGLYQKMRNEGVFDKMLAKPKEAKTTFNSRLLVETARRKHSKGK